MSEPTTTEDPTTPVPVPPGTNTTGTIKQIKVRRRMPELLAVCYDGTNAVQVAAWLSARGQGSNVSVQPNTPPTLLTPDGIPIPTGWVLANLEVIPDADLGTTYEKVADAG